MGRLGNSLFATAQTMGVGLRNVDPVADCTRPHGLLRKPQILNCCHSKRDFYENIFQAQGFARRCRHADGGLFEGLMNQAIHHFSELFAQLGLPNDASGIALFLTIHASMTDSKRLPDAPYWTPSQAAFLRDALTQDSDWTGLVDQLSAALRRPEED